MGTVCQAFAGYGEGPYLPDGFFRKLLSREIATSLRGRSISTEVFPFSFTESLDHAGIDVGFQKRPGSKKTFHLGKSSAGESSGRWISRGPERFR